MFKLRPALYTVLMLALAGNACASVCADMDLQAHRGSENFPENTPASVAGAYREGFDSAEIDVQMLKDREWVVHHDLLTGRVIRGRLPLPVLVMNSQGWDNAHVLNRDKSSSSLKAPFATDMLKVMAASANKGKKLNIEIKGKYACADVLSIAGLVSQKAPAGSWMYSSVDLDALRCLRADDKDVYLGVVVAPESDKSLVELKKRVGEKLYGDVVRKITGMTDPAKFYETIGNRNMMSETGIANIAKLGNAGIHIDALMLSRNQDIIRIAKKNGLKVYTYFEGTDENHVRTISDIYKQTGLKPQGMVINSAWGLTCSALKQAGVL